MPKSVRWVQKKMLAEFHTADRVAEMLTKRSPTDGAHFTNSASWRNMPLIVTLLLFCLSRVHEAYYNVTL